MPKSNHILRAMACGQSFDLNIKYKFYFDLASRGYSDFNYLGIYKGKTIRYIGKTENIIEANLDKSKGLEVINSEFKVTQEQEKRLTEAIKESNNNGWSLSSGHRFFLLNEFCKTNFRKTSPGGMIRSKYFNLENYFDSVPNNMKELAEGLKTKTWK